MKAFGVGCFHFSIGNKKSATLKVGSYVEEVLYVLKSLPSISDIQCRFDEDVSEEEFDIVPPNPRLSNGEECYPHIPFYHLEFSIYIPMRLQDDLSTGTSDTNSEKFRISIQHHWHGPLTFVESIAATSDSRPSNAVQIVRNYLEKETDKINTYLNFDFLGPSPFHADFFLHIHENESENVEFVVNVNREPGYDEIFIKANSLNYSSEELALEKSYEALSQELAFFYKVQQKRSGQIDRWHNIQGSLHAILEFESTKKLAPWYKRINLKSSLLSDAFTNTGLFKGQAIFDRGTIDSEYSAIYHSDKHRTYIKELVDEMISEDPEYPVDQTAELLTYIDQKTSKTFELWVVLAAGVFGGLIGSIVTVLFGK
jgi:hypothetical protein